VEHPHRIFKGTISVDDCVPHLEPFSKLTYTQTRTLVLYDALTNGEGKGAKGEGKGGNGNGNA